MFVDHPETDDPKEGILSLHRTISFFFILHEQHEVYQYRMENPKI